ncbi:uncharacterized protein LOC132045126 [Lycium ferocissimum]|uniref:uncharacterized protein LOC132045126 n=1 Tax=Lycium ferocissimum TaxID=112874 RepID=UPI00281686D1|nr:uncharacterized protein LOC132045126 [Lycium ferocissimum]
MKIAFFPCFVILLCALAVASRGVHLAATPERNSESAVADISGSNNNSELASRDFIADVEKNQRGRGANGGGSITRQPRTLDKNSAVTLKQPSISVSTTYVISSLPLLLALPFVIP